MEDTKNLQTDKKKKITKLIQISLYNTRVVIIIPVLWNVQMEYAEESSQLRNVII